MDAFTELIAKKFAIEIQKLNFVQTLPCKIIAINDNDTYVVELIANQARYTVLNYSGSPLNVGETVQLYYRGNIISNNTAFIGASITKGGSAVEEVYNAGKTVPQGTTVTVKGNNYTVGIGAEIFNDYSGNIAVNNMSHAEGSGSAAIGNVSHAEGSSTTASGNVAHAEGGSTVASGNVSHAEGGSTTASGEASHAEGMSSKAIGKASHAEGNSTTANGENSHAEGAGATAGGIISHAEGASTTANGAVSHAEGSSTMASGNVSHAEGSNTIAASANQHVQGRYNISDSSGKYAFIIGNGSTNSNRSNAFAIDWNGLIYINNAITGVDLNNLPTKSTNVIGTAYIGEIFPNYRNASKINLTALSNTDCVLHFDGTVFGTSSGTVTFTVFIDNEEQNFFCKQAIYSGSYQNVSFDYPVSFATGTHTVEVKISGIGNIYPIKAFVSGTSISADNVSPEIDENYTYDTDSGTSRVIYYKGENGTPEVPMKLGINDVSVLSATSFNYSGVINTYIPEGVEEIE